MNKAKVLVVEDDQDLREALCDTLEIAEFQCFPLESAEAALLFLDDHSVDMVVSDINMGGMNGHDLLERIRLKWPHLPVLLITAYGDISSAVQAMRSGAVDYLIKPFKPQLLVDAVCRYTKGFSDRDEDNAPVAQEPSSQELLALAQKVAATPSTVLISGESGTGKEVLARYIHAHSPRAKQPFIAINCAAIPENMLEATLFGHEKGAFTGAYAASAGKFEQANGGTILLDEISEMDLGLQAKLLRVLQEREVERVGGKKVLSLDVRVIATTNRDLLSHVHEGRFREDLYYRLSVFPMQWRALRERRADIQPLANRLLQVHAAKMGRANVSLDPAASAVLFAYDWPGNVRELDNVIQRALILQMGQVIGADDLMLGGAHAGAHSAATHITEHAFAATRVSASAFADKVPAVAEPLTDELTGLGNGMQQHEYQMIAEALRIVGGRKKQAAEKLGISPRTLRYKMAKMRDSGFDLDAAMSAF